MAVAFPKTVTPSSRSFSAGDWPVKTFKAQSGDETRILYGDKKSGLKLTLTYKNILDTQADDFIAHYDDNKGTYKSFEIGTTATSGELTKLLHGLAGDNKEGGRGILDAQRYDNKWRYTGPPQINQTFSGRSTISFTLVSVL